MKSDYELISVTRETEEGFRILPVADVHLGALEHMEREWCQFCASVLDQPRTYLVLGGDLMNNNTRSSVGNPFDEVLRPQEQKRILIDMLKPLRSRIWAMCLGNHEARSRRESDVDLMYDVACKLDIEDRYRQNVAVLKIQPPPVERHDLPVYVIAMTHGTGGGIYSGAALNRAERFGYYFDGIDALIVGHTHKPIVSQPSKLRVDARNNVVNLAPFKVVSLSSWMRYGGYAMGKMLQPSSHAPQVMSFAGGKKKEIIVSM